MDAPACPYLLRETLKWRESLDLSRHAPMRVEVVWWCAHPFHGLRLELGEDLAGVRRYCDACALPHPDASAAGRGSADGAPEEAGAQADQLGAEAV